MEFQTENTIIDKLPLNVNKSNSKTHKYTSMYGSTSSSNSESELDTSMDISINSFSSISHTNNEEKKFKDMSYEMTCFYIKNKPKAYIGLNPDWYNQGFIELLSIKSKVSERDILLTLMKIRLNDSFSRLSDFFGVSESVCCRIFNKTI